MTNGSADALRRARLNELPSPPDLLLPLLRLCGDDDAVPADACRTIGRDSVLSARLLAAASAPVFARRLRPTSLDTAVHALGMDTVQSLALAATVQQFFGAVAGRQHRWLPRVWEQALACATVARQLAEYTRSARPAEAYLAGLLHNIGQLVLVYQLPDDYPEVLQTASQGNHHLPALEREHFGIDHVELGAELLERWGLPALLVDAVRYQQEAPETLADTHGLVRTTAVARPMATCGHEPDATVRHAAGHLFDLGPSACLCVMANAAAERDRLSSALDNGPGDDPPLAAATGRDSAIGQELRQTALIGDARRHLYGPNPVNGIARYVALLFGINHLVCLQRGRNGETLQVRVPRGADQRLEELELPLDRDRSFLARSLVDNHPIHTLDPEARDALTIADRQLCSQMPSDGVLCLPMRPAGEAIGILVLGIRYDQISALLDESPLFLAFASEAGRALLVEEQRNRQRQERHDDEAANATLHREALVQAAADPLSIMQNYLSVLETQLEPDHPAHASVLSLSEEAGRLAALLRGADTPERGGTRPQGINDLIRAVMRLAERAGAIPDTIRPEVSLDRSLDEPVMPVPGVLRQVLLNLLRTMGEHLRGSDTISIRSSGFVHMAGERYIEVLLEDTGPGFPESLRQQLESGPRQTTGSPEAERLNVAGSLMRDAGGIMTCRSRPGEGTRIQLLIPTADAAPETTSRGSVAG
ncbi:HDOD domain-containing protein [Aquisalimonas asiatica]|uniref:Metal dependent phosphohydrolase n=1 Tax=Aquisalimonas asiatica TaxID=406100 RepID=A0A1H8TM96_9GAMM|nr:HDOD domain-containing protein [Aquisalimonas asiatica]SEO91588.1 metal dependent phosphohydrolase [Aquisalimonas asiatica]